MSLERLRFKYVSTKDLEILAMTISLELKNTSTEEDEFGTEKGDAFIFSATNHAYDKDFEWLRNFITPG